MARGRCEKKTKNVRAHSRELGGTITHIRGLGKKGNNGEIITIEQQTESIFSFHSRKRRSYP